MSDEDGLGPTDEERAIAKWGPFTEIRQQRPAQFLSGFPVRILFSAKTREELIRKALAEDPQPGWPVGHAYTIPVGDLDALSGGAVVAGFSADQDVPDGIALEGPPVEPRHVIAFASGITLHVEGDGVFSLGFWRSGQTGATLCKEEAIALAQALIDGLTA